MLIDLPFAVLSYTSVRVAERMRRGSPAQRLRRRCELARGGDDRALVPSPPPPMLDANRAGALTIASGALRALHLSPAFTLLNIAAYTYTMLPFYRHVERAVVRLGRERKVDSFLLMGIGNVLLLGSGSFLIADIGVALGNLFDRLSCKAKGTAERHLNAHLFDNLLDPRQRVWIERDGVELEYSLDEVRPRDILVLRAGEVIAVDGVVADGMASVDQHAFTGESYPVEKGVGEPVYASTLVLTGQLRVRVERSGRDTAIARIGAILEQSLAAKTVVQLHAEAWAERANLPFLVLAGLGFAVSGPMGAMVILGGNTVQAMQLLAPLGMINFQSAAAHQRIVLKNGAALERTGDIDTVLFDKTGTLTDGNLSVSRVHRLDPAGGAAAERELLAWAALAECRLSHPIARAIVAAAAALDIVPEPSAEQGVRLGFGVMVEDGGRTIHVGSARFMTAEGIAVPASASALEQAIHQRGHSLVLVALDGVAAGVIELTASLRPDLPTVIKGLRQRGIRHIGIVSGDHTEPTRRLAAEIGADAWHAEVLPEQKAEIVRRYRDQGHQVCFVGDGVNDAIALQEAHLSVSLSGATTLAIDVADCVLMDPDLRLLNALLDLSAELDANLKRGLALCYTGMGIVVVGSLLVNMGLLMAMSVHAVLGSTAIGNAMLPLRGREAPKGKYSVKPSARSESMGHRRKSPV